MTDRAGETSEGACQIVDPGKPAFTFAGFVAALARNAAGLPTLLAAYLAPGRIEPAVREAAMVAVSRMNRCRHCTAIHSAWGAAVGMGDGAVDDRDSDPSTLAGRFARCVVAGTDLAAAERELAQRFSPSEVRQLAAVARAIDFANRCGNTWDAFEGRLSSRPNEGSSLVDELAVLGVLAPAGVPFLALSRLVRALRGEPRFSPPATQGLD
jgi:AhpD family alkylhydroperoxidase